MKQEHFECICLPAFRMCFGLVMCPPVVARCPPCACCGRKRRSHEEHSSDKTKEVFESAAHRVYKLQRAKKVKTWINSCHTLRLLRQIKHGPGWRAMEATSAIRPEWFEGIGERVLAHQAKSYRSTIERIAKSNVGMSKALVLQAAFIVMGSKDEVKANRMLRKKQQHLRLRIRDLKLLMGRELHDQERQELRRRLVENSACDRSRCEVADTPFPSPIVRPCADLAIVHMPSDSSVVASPLAIQHSQVLQEFDDSLGDSSCLGLFSFGACQLKVDDHREPMSSLSERVTGQAFPCVSMALEVPRPEEEEEPCLIHPSDVMTFFFGTCADRLAGTGLDPMPSVPQTLEDAPRDDSALVMAFAQLSHGLRRQERGVKFPSSGSLFARLADARNHKNYNPKSAMCPKPFGWP